MSITRTLYDPKAPHPEKGTSVMLRSRKAAKYPWAISQKNNIVRLSDRQMVELIRWAQDNLDRIERGALTL